MRVREDGFTLLELVVTLAVVSILAAVALPVFTGESRKAQAISEVQPLFNDLRVRLEQYLQENGRYPVTAGEVSWNPAGAPGDRRSLDLIRPDWQPLKLRISGEDFTRCRYTWSTGAAGDDTNIGSEAASVFGFVAPATHWYYLLARCDMNGDGVFSWHFSSSQDSQIRMSREGD